jgi:tetratricopeptide (TPR) repeat protein
MAQPLPRSTISDKLTAKSVPGWDFVVSFVAACRAHADENGISLPAELTDLADWDAAHWQLLRAIDEAADGERLAATVRAEINRRGDRPGTGTTEQVPRQLPPVSRHFTGRASQLDELTRLAREAAEEGAMAIAVIEGMAGVGKTALAVVWGHRERDRFPDGQVYLDLRGYAVDAPMRPIEALAQLLGALGVPAERIPTDVATATGQYRSRLADRRVLVVLDNAASADQVRPLLPASPGCMVVVTSRDRLSGLAARDGAVLLTLGVLTTDEAHRLLTSVLGADRVGIEPDAAAELARACSYLPLALRVAAANATSQPFPSIADHVAALRTGDRLATLTVEGDDLTGVRFAFDLSYRAQCPAARRLFRLLGLVPGADITVPAAAALAGAATDHVARLLNRLAGAHLVDQPSWGRYSCHDLLSEYAADRAGREDSATERQAALARLHEWYLRRAGQAAQILYPQRTRLPGPADSVPGNDFDGDTAALAWLDLERRNLMAAVRHTAEHGPRKVAWLLSDTLRGYFWLRMNVVDWLDTAERALRAAELDGSHHGQAAALLSIGDVHFRLSEYPRAIDCYARALASCRLAGWVDGEVAAQGNLGATHHQSGHIREAAGHYAEALTRSRTSGSRHGTEASEAITAACLGSARYELGQLAEAAELGAHALAHYRKIGSRQGEAATLTDLGRVYVAQEDWPRAMECFTRALELSREIGDRGIEAISLHGLAATHLGTGDTTRARDLAVTAVVMASEIGDRRVEVDALNTLATVEHQAGRPAVGRTHHRRALDLARATGDHYPEVEALLGLATCDESEGEVAQALEHARQAHTIAADLGFGLLDTQALALMDRLTTRGPSIGPLNHR